MEEWQNPMALPAPTQLTAAKVPFMDNVVLAMTLREIQQRPQVTHKKHNSRKHWNSKKYR